MCGKSVSQDVVLLGTLFRNQGFKSLAKESLLAPCSGAH
jgi:hypothetical protein